MKIFWSVIRFFFAAFMIYAGVQHLLKPDFYIPFVPSFLPFTMAIVYASGIIEILLGVFLLIPKFAKLGALGLLVLMLLFLPIHIWDVFSETPAIGSQKAAYIRLAVQLLFIAIAWKIRATLSR